MKTTDFAEYLTSYFSVWLPGQRNLSSNTILSYRDTFRLLLVYCKTVRGINPEKLTVKMLTESLVSEFLQWLEDGRGCSITTRNQRLAAIHAFVRYLQLEAPEQLLEFQRILAIPSKKASHKPVEYLSPDALSAVLSCPELSTPKGRRDLAVLTLLYDSGARVSELADLTVRDVRLDAPSTLTLHGKGRKTRCVPLMSKTTALMRSYFAEQDLLDRSEKLDAPVFFNSRGEKLTRAGIAYILDKYVKRVKNDCSVLLPESVSPHCMRHSKAVHMLQANVNLIYIRDFLGHVNISTTEIYAKVDAQAKRSALEKAYVSDNHTGYPEWNDNKDLMSWLNNLCK